jgi:hypothetical protein
MNTLHIEWRHLNIQGNTCARCAETGAALRKVIQELTLELAGRGIQASFEETTLSTDEILRSNTIFFNGTPLEDVVPGVSVGFNHCQSCCELTGSTTMCRTIQWNGIVYEGIPIHLIRWATLKVLGMDKELPIIQPVQTVCC